MPTCTKRSRQGKSASARDTQADFYVASDGNDRWSGRLALPAADGSDGPFATLTRAIRAVRQLRGQQPEPQPTRVLIRGGTYLLTRPIVLSPADSGTRDAWITYAAYPGERPVFSGGQAISGWKKGKAGVWAASVAGVAEGQWYFHQLFVNGQRRQRARHPNQGYLRIAGPMPEFPNPQAARGNKAAAMGFQYQPGDLKRFRNLADVNILLYHAWTASLHWIEALDTRKHTVHFTAPSGWPVGYWEREQRYVIENCREALDSPGEWYLDRQTGKLHYYPLPGEEPEQCEIVAPRLEELLVLRGRPEAGKYVAHLTFKGLSFQHADWSVADKGPADGQAAVWLGATIFARGVQCCVFEDCEIAHGGRYGLWLERGCQDNRLFRCEVHDLGAGGIKIGETSTTDKAALATAHNTVDNCFVHDGGHVFPAGVGVLVLRSSSNWITHNEICDFYYTGVSVGWSWGYAPTSASQNIVEYNHIHHLGKGVLSDMGGIYTLGISPGTRLRFNLIHDVQSYSYGGWGLYTDEGSTHILIENNVCYNTKTGGFHQHYGRENVVVNNVLAFSREMQVTRTRQEPHASFDFEHNIVYCTNQTALAGRWGDNNYRMERNVYWRASGGELDFAGLDFKHWQAEGRDLESVVADPLFVDAEHFDFRLQPESPALRLGIHPIDLSQVGLYGESEWVNKPSITKRPQG